MTWRRTLLLLSLVLAACGGDSTAPTKPGTLTLRLATPNSNDGALVVVVSGGVVTAVHPAGNLEVTRQVDGAGTHLLLVGDLAEGIIATIDVPDIAHASAYVAVVEQAADRTTFALLDPAAYRITIVPAP
ncbi:MAG: hypothetical protein ABIZ70_03180 [Gemmatimonadales bacterium]